MKIWHILLTVLMLSVLVLLHELGHYIAARIFKVPIKEFAIGMGPRLFGWTSKRTGIKYSVRLLPIGGYVSMVGEDEDSSDENALNKKPVWQRMIITAAGAVMNLLTGFVVMLVVVLITPELNGTVVKEFTVTEYTAASGLRVGDEILSVGGDNVHVLGDLNYEIMHDATVPVDLRVRRDGEVIVLEDVRFYTETVDGITVALRDFRTEAQPKNVGNVLKHTWYRSISTVKMVWESLIDLIGGRYGIEHMSGPVGVATAVSDAASLGADSFFYLATAIAMNLGVFNLLPLPALDGGRLFFQLIELIRRKPLKPEIEGYIHFGGIVLLMLLMVVITFKDIIGLF